MKTILAGSVGAILVLATAGTTQAHHSFAMFDNQKAVNIEGSVVEWQWSNPHAFLEVRVQDATGKNSVYVLEGPSTNYLTRRGWSKRSFKAGDKVSVVLAPLKDGRPGGLLQRATVNGKQLPEFDANPGLLENRAPAPAAR